MDLPDRARRWKSVDALERWLPGPAARLVHWARSDESLSTAASLAFFALVSLPPMTMIALWMAAFVAGDERIAALGEAVAAFAPEDVDADEIIMEVVEVAVTLGWTSVLAAVWPATAYGAGLARALERLTPVGERAVDAWKGRILAVAIIATLPTLVLAALVAMLLMPQLLEGMVPPLLGLAGVGAVALAVLAGVLAILYDAFSPVDVDAWAALRGGAWAAALVTLISIGYAVYLRLGANFEERYGSSAVAAVILLGLWLYLVNGALVVGYKTALIRADVPAWREQRDS